MAGSRSLKLNWDLVSTLTIGVVIFVVVPSIVETAVADAPILIFMISPMASISMALKVVVPIVLILLHRYPSYPRDGGTRCFITQNSSGSPPEIL